MPPALGRFLRITGLSAAIAFVYGLARSARRPSPPEPAGVASWPPLVPTPDVETRTGPVQFATPPSASEAASDTTAADAPSADEPRWVDATDGACPTSHPIKGNADSMIFHVPGGMSYDRTHAERCYCTAEDAEADGFRQAKR